MSAKGDAGSPNAVHSAAKVAWSSLRVVEPGGASSLPRASSSFDSSPCGSGHSPSRSSSAMSRSAFARAQSRRLRARCGGGQASLSLMRRRSSLDTEATQARSFVRASSTGTPRGTAMVPGVEVATVGTSSCVADGAVLEHQQQPAAQQFVARRRVEGALHRTRQRQRRWRGALRRPKMMRHRVHPSKTQPFDVCTRDSRTVQLEWR